MKKICLFILCGILISAVSGCATIKGAGEDIGTVGKWLTRSSDSVKNNTKK